MSRSLFVERAGLQTVVVDSGRYGYRDEGLAWCGPADALAYEAANALLLNDERAAALEILMGDVEIRFGDARACAIAGADCDARLDGARIHAWCRFVTRAGSALVLRRPKTGVFTYLAVDGGINVPLVLGSRTTDRVARIGGYEGRALQRADEIALGSPDAGKGVPFTIAPPEARDVVRVISGGEAELFEASGAALFGAPWTVGHESNRMGYRLHGAPLVYRGGELPSHAVFPGIIQVPPSGEPIVLLSDAHTTGGYPKLGAVFDVDLRAVAQMRPGEALRFVPGVREEALAASRRRAGYVKALREIALERSRR